jgi:hypothetical protein
LIFDDELTYAWGERETALGPVRIDFLMRRIPGVVEMKQFLLELGGKPIGRIGEHKAADDKILHTNWYCGLRQGNFAFKIIDSHDFKENAFRQARLEIWTKENVGKMDSTSGC